MHLFLKKKGFAKCSKCGKPVLPHTICQNCGQYKGREVIDVLAKLEKKERKKREREIAAKENEGGKDDSLSMEGLSKK